MMSETIERTTEFTINDEQVKRHVDKKLLQNIHLEDIVSELQRRGVQILYGRGYPMIGRVLFLPANREMMERRERPEITTRVEVKSGADASNMGVSTKRQDQPESEIHPHLSESSGSPGSGSEEESLDRVQGDEGERDTVQVGESTPTSSTDGVRAEESEKT